MLDILFMIASSNKVERKILSLEELFQDCVQAKKLMLDASEELIGKTPAEINAIIAGSQKDSKIHEYIKGLNRFNECKKELLERTSLEFREVTVSTQHPNSLIELPIERKLGLAKKGFKQLEFEQGRVCYAPDALKHNVNIASEKDYLSSSGSAAKQATSSDEGVFNKVKTSITNQSLEAHSLLESQNLLTKGLVAVSGLGAGVAMTVNAFGRIRSGLGFDRQTDTAALNAPTASRTDYGKLALGSAELLAGAALVGVGGYAAYLGGREGFGQGGAPSL